MKKNTMMRFASVLMVAVLLTTCVISGTFAKYITEGAGEDDARVAKWGVAVTTTNTGLFSGTYENEEVIDEAAIGTTVSVSTDGGDLVAPGTTGSVEFSISGQPEVAVRVKVDFTATKDVQIDAGVTVDGGALAENYNPVKFTLKKDGVAVSGAEGVTLAVLAEKVEAISAEYPASADLNLDATYEISWVWDFGDGSNDAKDTALGDAAVTPVSGISTDLAFTYTITVEQID